MSLIKRIAILFAAVAISIVNIEAADGVLYLIKPVFDTTTLGVGTDSDERAELYEMLTGHCSKIFKSKVQIIDRQAIDDIMSSKADFLIWDLEHYHYLYEDQEHVPCLKASLYRFSAENNYVAPIVAVTPPIVTGESAYGNMAPFREGIDANFKALKKIYKKGFLENQEISRYSAETILNNNPLRDVTNKIFVTVSPIDDSSVGTSPADYELFHLPRMVAHFVGDLFGKNAVVVNENIVTQIKEQSLTAQIVRIGLRHLGDEDNELTLSLYKSPDLEKALFTTTVKDPEKGRWSMNDEFQEGLEAIFKTIRQKMGSQGK